VLLGLLPLVALVAGADEERLIALHGDALTVRLVNAPVTEVLEDIGRQSGAQIRGTVQIPRAISTEFADVPLPEALHRLLGDQDFALVYSDTGQLRAVKLLDASDGPPPQPKPIETSTTELMRVVSGHDPVKLNGVLADAVGAPTASIVQLFDLGMGHDAPIVRLEAVRAMVALLESDERVRNALMTQLHFMDDVQVTSFLRSRVGTHAEDFLQNVTVQSGSVALRERASSVLQRLRGAGVTPEPSDSSRTRR
jgi:hypothetical protein